MNNIVRFKGVSLPTKGLGANVFLKAKDVVGVQGHTPFLRLKAKGKHAGDWVYGPSDTEVEENSQWAINPASFQTGFIAWKGGRPVGKKLRPINHPEPYTRDDLPVVGAEWDVCVSFDLKCVYGSDAGTEVEFTNNSFGSRKAFSQLMSEMHRQTEEDGVNIVPIVELKSEPYDHSEWGQQYNPIFEIKKWVRFDKGEDAAQETSPPEKESGAPVRPAEAASRVAAPAEAEPRRRRVAPESVTDIEDTIDLPSAKAAPEQAEPVQRRRRRAVAPAAV